MVAAKKISTMTRLHLAHKLFSAMLSLLLHGCRPPPPPSPHSNCSPPPPPPMVRRCAVPPSTVQNAAALVVDVDSALLRSTGSDDLFPYFLLVALEAGGFLRGLLLLLLSPLIRIVFPGSGGGAAVRAMALVSFCGLRAGARFRAGRAVLPKWLMEDVAAEAFDAVRAAAASGGAVVGVSAMPRVMVDGFLREYLGVETVVAREMKVVWGFYTGLMEELPEGGCEMVVEKAVAAAVAAPEVEEKEEEEESGGGKQKKKVVVGFSGSMEFLEHPISRCCKEIFIVSSDEKSKWRPLSKDKYPKPIIFHDGRLAFRPTFAATAAMFAWLPVGIPLGAARLAIALTVPYRYSTPILAATGMSWRLKGSLPAAVSSVSGDNHHRRRGQLFVCNHRTLIDPVYVSVALDRQVRAVSYSLSRLSELISPIGRTVRLTRDRDSDGAAMAKLLAGGDLVVVCPEGTTCREPYLLRFSPLFAELADDVVPVGIAAETSMFYATTAGGLKCFDPLYYMVNPRMCYTVQFLEKVDTSGVRRRVTPSTDVANKVQRMMGDALGFGCTMLTRKDKYLMLAGNDGVVGGGSTGGDNKSVSAAAVGGSAGAGGGGATAVTERMKKKST